MKTLTISILLLALSLLTYSQTIIPGGDVSGTWTQANSPYLINGTIQVPSASTLSIEPGVNIVFQGNYTFTVKGNFYAIGAESDSIRFTVSDTTGYYNGTYTGWGGLNFSYNPTSGLTLDYCIIEYSTGFGLVTVNYNFISNCDFRYNQEGGIHIVNYLQITSTKIHDNKGYGIYSTSTEWAHLTIENFEIENNLNWGICFDGAQFGLNATNGLIINNHGGGIRFNHDGPINLNNVIIDGNGPNTQGGGIYTTGDLTIHDCTIENNQANEGGGIYYAGGSCTFGIHNSKISSNTANTRGGGISIRSGFVQFTIENTIISNNTAYDGGGIYDYDLSQF